LAAISDAEPPAVTRIVFTPTDLKARAWMIARCQEVGLPCDRMHRKYFAVERSRSCGTAVGTGSHIDAIPNAAIHVSLEFWADSKQFARCSGADSAKNSIELSYSPRKSDAIRHRLLGAGCFRELSRLTPLAN